MGFIPGSRGAHAMCKYDMAIQAVDLGFCLSLQDVGCRVSKFSIGLVL